MTPPPDLAAGVGGIVHLEYRLPGALAVHPIRLGVEPFDPTPSGPDGDYLYTSPHGERGVLATVAALGALWAPYYPDAWQLNLVGVWRNVAGFAAGPLALPLAPSIPGSYASLVTAEGVVKRTLALYSQQGARWRVRLRQGPGSTVGQRLNAGAGVAGTDARDQAFYAYVGGSTTAILGRDGTPFQSGGRVSVWWDAPLAVGATGPYLVSG